jgi:hypothetical protein
LLIRNAVKWTGGNRDVRGLESPGESGVGCGDGKAALIIEGSRFKLGNKKRQILNILDHHKYMRK